MSGCYPRPLCLRHVDKLYGQAQCIYSKKLSHAQLASPWLGEPVSFSENYEIPRTAMADIILQLDNVSSYFPRIKVKPKWT